MMKKTLLFSLIISLSILSFSCKKDSGTKKSDNKGTAMLTLSDDERTYPLSSSSDGRYKYFTEKADYPANASIAARSIFVMSIDDKDKKYIGDLANYKETERLELGLFIPQTLMLGINENSTKINLVNYQAQMTNTLASFSLNLQGSDHSRYLVEFTPVTGQSFLISKKNNTYYIDIDYIKMQDLNGKQAIMRGLKFEAAAN